MKISRKQKMGRFRLTRDHSTDGTIEPTKPMQESCLETRVDTHTYADVHAQEKEIYKRVIRCVNVRSSEDAHTSKLRSDVLGGPGNSCKGWVSGLSRLEIFRWFMEKWFPIPRDAAVVGERVFEENAEEIAVVQKMVADQKMAAGRQRAAGR